MDKKKLKLLIKSLDKDFSGKEKDQLDEALGRSVSLQEEKRKLEKIQSLLKEQDYSFKPSFVDRVMNKTSQQRNKKIIFPDFSNGFSLAFKRVVLTGAAAILILLFSVYFSRGSFSFDSLIGADSISEENYVTYILYDF